MKGKIFNAQEVQAIIAGNKTMFREVIKPQPNSNINPVKLDYLCRTWQWATKESRRECPYKVGQKIFVKESFAVSKTLFQDIKYLADNQKKWGFINNDLAVWKKRPAQHMKQEHSRLTLEITDVKVERLGEISEEDAIKEGVWNIQEKGSPRNWDIKNAFATFWNATQKKPEEKFEANPFVWVVDFKINN